MLTSITIIIFFLGFTLIYFVLKKLFKPFLAIQKRLDQVVSENAIPLEEDSMVQKWINRNSEKSKQKNPKKPVPAKNLKLQNQLDASGLGKKMDASQWIFFKSILIFCIGALFLLLMLFTKNTFVQIVFAEIIIVLIVNMAMRFMILSGMKKRKLEILRALPYTLDLVTVSVEAGLSFDGAIARVMDATQNALTEEFSRALKEMRMGISRKLALKSLSERCNVNELSTVVNALIQGDELGVSLGRILRIQADQVREMRKQVAREKSMKAPVKMLFPLILFIFPTIFVVILGPAVIQIIESFR